MFEVRQELVHAWKGDDEVAIARDVECGHGDRHPGERRLDLPVAIEIAVVVERAAEAGAQKFTGVEVHIGFAEPGRQLQRRARTLQEAPTPWHHAGARSCTAARS